MADTSSSGHVEEPKNFAPKTPVNLAPPRDDRITYEELAKCDGKGNAISVTFLFRSQLLSIPASCLILYHKSFTDNVCSGFCGI